MATASFTANAANINYVGQIVVANTWATSDTATATINGKDLVVTVGSTATTTGVAIDIKEAWESTSPMTDTTASYAPTSGGTSLPEFSEITASIVTAGTVKLTGDTAGVPHTVTATESTAGDGTATYSQVTAGTGSKDWSNVDNWDGGSVPVSTDTVILDRASVDILYGLDQSAVTLTELRVGDRWSGNVGLPVRNALGYEEYREDYLKISATTTNYRGTSGRFKLNNGSVQAAVNVFRTGTTAETGRSAFQWLGTNASNVVNVFGGDVGICANTGEVSTVATVRQTGGTLVIGAGGTITTVDKSGGTLTMYCGCTTLTNDSGTARVSAGAGTVTTINVGAGTLFYDGTGTITTVNAYGGVLDLSGNTASVTITNLNVYGNLTINDPAGRLVLTNQPTVYAGKLTFAKS